MGRAGISFEWLLADIAPPRPALPSLPFSESAVPETWQIVVAGLLLSGAVAVLGLLLTRKTRFALRVLLPLILAVPILAATVCFAAWAWGQHADYARAQAEYKQQRASRRANWRGPPQEEYPIPDPEESGSAEP